MIINKNSEALQFGYGVFETMLYENGQIVHFDEHIKRLQNSLTALNIPWISKAILKQAIDEEIKEDPRIEFVLKLTCLLDEGKTRILITTRENPYSEVVYEKGYVLITSDVFRHSKNPILSHKTTNNISNKMEMIKLKSAGFDEAVHMNENHHITEGVYANIFFVKAGCLYTAACDCGLLPGIQRAAILKRAESLGIPTEIGYYSIKDLEEADEIFMTSALLKVMPVRQFKNQIYDMSTNVVTKLLYEEMML